MIAWIARRLKLQPDETQHALVLGLVLFALTSSYTLVKTARDAYYLANLPAETLPWVFIGVGVLTFLAAAAFTQWTRHRSTFETLAGTAMISAISLAAFAYLFRFTASWLPVALYLWVNVYGLLLMSQFWVFANSVSDPREAKRIYGLVGVGGILGGLFGGLVAPGLATAWGLSSLLVASAILLVAGVGVIASSVNRSKLPPAESVPSDGGSGGAPIENAYVRWLALAALCSVVVTGVLDYVFKVQIQHRYSGPDRLATFLGFYYMAVNLASLTMQLFATRWVLQRFGAGWGAALLPAGLGAGAAITLVLPEFAPVVLTRLWDQLTRQSINRSAVEMFYFPLEPALRRRAKSMIDAGLERLGDGLAGITILAMSATIGATVFSISALMLALVVVWGVAWLRVRKRYVTELGRNLRRMNLSPHGMTVSLREASLLAEMTRLLDSPYQRVILHAMDLMAEVAPDRLVEHLPRLMEHAVAAVRARALTLAAAHGVEGVGERAVAMLEDPSSEVRVAALRAHSALDCEDPSGRLQELMESPDRNLRLTALQCIVEFSPAVEEQRILGLVESIVREGDAEQRLAIAAALGRRPPPSALHDLLRPLLTDSDVGTRRAAMRSAGSAKLRIHVPILIEALGERSTQRAAREGLAGYGDSVSGTLGDWLTDSSVPLEVRREIPRVLGDIGTQEAVNGLFRHRSREDVRLSYRVLKALNNVRSSHDGLRMRRDLVMEDLRHDARSHLFAFVHYRTCPIGTERSAERLLCIALNERMDQAMNRMFRRLALLYPPRDIYAAYRGLVSDDRRRRGNALEYLDNALSGEHRQLLWPFVESPGDAAMLDLARGAYGIRYVNYNTSLGEILEGDDPWLRACALFVVGSRREESLLERVKENLTARNSWVRETARWAQGALVRA